MNCDTNWTASVKFVDTCQHWLKSDWKLRTLKPTRVCAYISRNVYSSEKCFQHWETWNAHYMISTHLRRILLFSRHLNKSEVVQTFPNPCIQHSTLVVWVQANITEISYFCANQRRLFPPRIYSWETYININPSNRTRPWDLLRLWQKWVSETEK
jgi:hypothetical protein